MIHIACKYCFHNMIYSNLILDEYEMFDKESDHGTANTGQGKTGNKEIKKCFLDCTIYVMLM